MLMAEAQPLLKLAGFAAMDKSVEPAPPINPINKDDLKKIQDYKDQQLKELEREGKE